MAACPPMQRFATHPTYKYTVTEQFMSPPTSCGALGAVCCCLFVLCSRLLETGAKHAGQTGRKEIVGCETVQAVCFTQHDGTDEGASLGGGAGHAVAISNHGAGVGTWCFTPLRICPEGQESLVAPAMASNVFGVCRLRLGHSWYAENVLKGTAKLPAQTMRLLASLSRIMKARTLFLVLFACCTIPI